MRNPPARLAIVLTALLIPAFAILTAQQSTAPLPANPQSDPSLPFKIGGPVKAPKVLYSVEPKYTEEARRKKFSGTVKLYCWVDEEGIPSHIKVVRGVGMGLDEQAIEALQHFKFRPATRDNQPVKVELYIEISFQLL